MKNNFLKIICICYTIAFCTNLKSTEKENTNVDTSIFLNNIVIKETKKIKIQNTNIDFLSSNLGYINSNFIVKNYGWGQLSSFSFRGLNSDNTAIIWQGFKINSILNGSYDLNNLTSANINESYFDKNNLIYGNGGALNLDKKSTEKLNVSFAINSMNTYSLNTNNNLKINKTVISNSFSLINGKNNFNFYNPFNNSIESQHSDLFIFNSMIESKTAFKSINLVFGLMSEINNKNPTNHLLYKSNQNIKNNNFRFITGFDSKKINLKFMTFLENQKYNDYTYNINTDNDIFGISNNLNLNISNSPKHNLTFGINSNLYNANSGNYDSKINSFDFINNLNLNYFINNSNNVELSIKNTFYNEKLSFLYPSITYNNWINSKLLFSAHASINTKYPYFNDLYWNPGGNINLKNETNYNINTTLKYNKNKLNISIEPYFYKIKNAIKWVLKDTVNYIYSPINIANLTTYGCSFYFTYGIKLNQFDLFLENSINILNSKIDDNKELSYTPKYKNILNFKLNFDNLQLNINNLYTSTKFTSELNNKELSELNIWNSDLNIVLNKYLKLTFLINNIFDVDYFEIENYPMPKRNTAMKLSFSIL